MQCEIEDLPAGNPLKILQKGDTLSNGSVRCGSGFMPSLDDPAGAGRSPMSEEFCPLPVRVCVITSVTPKGRGKNLEVAAIRGGRALKRRLARDYST